METQRTNLFGHATSVGWSINENDEPWRESVAWWMTRQFQQDSTVCAVLNAVKFREDDPHPQVELPPLTVADLTAIMVERAVVNLDSESHDCEMKFVSPASPMGKFPIAPSMTSPSTYDSDHTTRYDLAGGSPVFVVSDTWAIPHPLFFEHQFCSAPNDRKRKEIGELLDLSWLRADAFRAKRPLALIAIPPSPELVGKVVILETDEFHFVGCRGDPVRRGENAGKPLIRPDISFNPFQVIPNLIDRPSQPQDWLNIDVSELVNMCWHNSEDARTWGGKEHGLRNDPHPFLSQAGYFAGLVEFCVETAMARSVAVKDMDGGHVVQAGESIPAWRDKRGVKVFDRATPRYPVFHDEIRCPSCNGRHLIKLPSGNQISECKCLHEPCEQVIQFPHLVSRKHENGGTADGER